MDKRYIAAGTLGYWRIAVKSVSAAGTVKVTEPLTEAAMPANEPFLLALPGERFYTQEGDDVSTRKSISLEGRSIRFVSAADEFPATPAELVYSKADALSDYTARGTYGVLLGRPMLLLKNHYTSDGQAAFVYNEAGNLLPFRLYIDTGGTAPATRAMQITVDFSGTNDGPVTAITLPGAGGTDGGPLYNINGVPVSRAALPGVYVRNGKKILSR